jgi:hypothetical protein
MKDDRKNKRKRRASESITNVPNKKKPKKHHHKGTVPLLSVEQEKDPGTVIVENPQSVRVRGPIVPMIQYPQPFSPLQPGVNFKMTRETKTPYREEKPDNQSPKSDPSDVQELPVLPTSQPMRPDNQDEIIHSSSPDPSDLQVNQEPPILPTSQPTRPDNQDGIIDNSFPDPSSRAVSSRNKKSSIFFSIHLLIGFSELERRFDIKKCAPNSGSTNPDRGPDTSSTDSLKKIPNQFEKLLKLVERNLSNRTQSFLFRIQKDPTIRSILNDNAGVQIIYDSLKKINNFENQLTLNKLHLNIIGSAIFDVMKRDNSLNTVQLQDLTNCCLTELERVSYENTKIDQSIGCYSVLDNLWRNNSYKFLKTGNFRSLLDFSYKVKNSLFSENSKLFKRDYGKCIKNKLKLNKNYYTKYLYLSSIASVMSTNASNSIGFFINDVFPDVKGNILIDECNDAIAILLANEFIAVNDPVVQKKFIPAVTDHVNKYIKNSNYLSDQESHTEIVIDALTQSNLFQEKILREENFYEFNQWDFNNEDLPDFTEIKLHLFNNVNCVCDSIQPQLFELSKYTEDVGIRSAAINVLTKLKLNCTQVQELSNSLASLGKKHPDVKDYIDKYCDHSLIPTLPPSSESDNLNSSDSVNRSFSPPEYEHCYSPIVSAFLMGSSQGSLLTLVNRITLLETRDPVMADNVSGLTNFVLLLMPVILDNTDFFIISRSYFLTQASIYFAQVLGFPPKANYGIGMAVSLGLSMFEKQEGALLWLSGQCGFYILTVAVNHLADLLTPWESQLAKRTDYDNKMRKWQILETKPENLSATTHSAYPEGKALFEQLKYQKKATNQQLDRLDKIYNNIKKLSSGPMKTESPGCLSRIFKYFWMSKSSNGGSENVSIKYSAK